MVHKTIDDVIMDAITTGPMNEFHERIYTKLKKFIESRFNIAYEAADTKDQLEMMRNLFASLTNRRPK